MSIYAVITSPQDLDHHQAGSATLEDQVIWEGVESGIFRFVSPLQSQRGAVVEMTSDDAQAARAQLDGLLFVANGMVDAELLATPVEPEARGGTINVAYRARFCEEDLPRAFGLPM